MKTEIKEQLGVSGIAWNTDEDEAVRGTLSTRSVKFIDIAPTKYFDWTDHQHVEKSRELQKRWLDAGITIRGMQSLLFGQNDLNILNVEDHSALIEHFKNVFEIAGALGAEKLVFGSPANRKKGDLSTDVAESIALDFFSNLGALLTETNITIQIEANPVDYGCDFLTETREAAKFVQTLSNESIRAQLDLGTCMVNSENPFELLAEFPGAFGYVHLATKKLEPLQNLNNPLVREFVNGYSGPLKCTVEQRAEFANNSKILSETIDWLSSC